MLQKQIEHQIADLNAMQEFAKRLLDSIKPPCCVYLHGNLGAGKTTLVQFIMAALGYQGTVASPTYNLIQSYELGGQTIHHLDLYRLNDPEELEYLGLLDLWDQRSVFLVEWPSKGGEAVFPADLEIHIEVGAQNERTITLS